MARKEMPLQPATKEKKCQVCGTEYIYPEKGSPSTRFHCEVCAGLPEAVRKAMGRLAKRVQELERKLKQGNQS